MRDCDKLFELDGENLRVFESILLARCQMYIIRVSKPVAIVIEYYRFVDDKVISGHRV